MALSDTEKAEIIEALLNELKAASTDVTNLNTVNSLTDVNSLPAMKQNTLVSVPISILAEPAITAASKANSAAEAASDAASFAADAADEANEAASKANEAASAASAFSLNLSQASPARFAGFVENANITDTATSIISAVFFDTTSGRFCVAVDEDVLYTLNWPNADVFLTADRTAPLPDKVYLCEDRLYVWSQEKGTLIEASGKGSGSGFYNVSSEQPLSSGFYTKETAVAALKEADIDDEAKPGMIISFLTADGQWLDYRFASSDVSLFLSPSYWQEYGSGKVKSLSLNGSTLTPDANGNVNVPAVSSVSLNGSTLTPDANGNVDVPAVSSVSLNGNTLTPDANGNVNIAIDQISVDESLDAESTNPVENGVVTKKMEEISEAAVGGIEVIEGDEKNTLNILNKKGSIIASAEFSGGGGGGTSTASRIVLSCSLDKQQVKEGGSAVLSYAYSHVNAEGNPDGVKADITVSVSRGSTTTYENTSHNVSDGTFSLDISDYLLVGTTEVYVRATATSADGSTQTKQAYAAISVVTLTLTSSYNLATPLANGGYQNGDTIIIPFTITGSGSKDVSLYLDGSNVPLSQTISKSGTVNGSFSIAASSLSAGRHNVQLIAERSGLLSDSIYIDILKAGSTNPYIGVKYTDKSGTIYTGSNIYPVVQAAQYEECAFQYVAYLSSTPSVSVDIALDGTTPTTVAVPRTMQSYTTRFTSQGSHSVSLSLNNSTYSLNIEVAESSLAVSETSYGLLAHFSAAGRTNTEQNPAEWTSNGITTAFDGFNWSSNGWTGSSLHLTGGAKAVINYQPFLTDCKSSGLTLEITMKVSNILNRSTPVLSCIDDGKGILISAEEVSFRTGQTVSYTNEEDEQVSREVKLSTNYVADEWIKVALSIDTVANNRLMCLYVDGNRRGADIYDSAFNFAQDNPQYITINSSEADVDIKDVRIYSRAISDDEELENYIVDASSTEEMLSIYEDNDILGETGNIDIDRLRNKGKGVLRFVREGKLVDVYTTNNKKTDFVSDVYFYSPFGSDYDFVLKNCYIRIQGTSSTKYPSKNIRIYFNKGTEALEFSVGGEVNPLGKNKYCMRQGATPMNLFTIKSDYSDSSMSLNTGGAKLFNEVMKELGLLTPPQQFQYQQAGNQLSAISARTAIDGFPIDVFVAETADGESEYVGQYNFNNEKSKSEDLFGMTGVDGFSPAMPLTFETLNNTAKMCLFQSDSDEQIPEIFDDGLETNYPDDVKWAGLSADNQAAVTRLYSWLRECVPAGASANNISSFVSQKFVSEVSQFFNVKFLCTYYLFTDYFLSVDQRAKNMMLRTWDGLIWYLTFYDGDTQLGKRNDCFLVYDYTTDRDTYDAEAAKYAFEGRESWLWNLVLANLQDSLMECAASLRTVLTNDRAISMFSNEQIGNWSSRASNKSGEIKYINPATHVIYGKTWPYIYALQGSNKSHIEYFIKNRFALLDAKYQTANFTSDNIDLYLSRTAANAADTLRITAAEIYAFGYGTNNSPNIANSGLIKGAEVATLSITGAYTVNDPLRVYGASRMQALDMSSAANHLKNGLDLGKCTLLRSLDLHTSGTSGSTGWWLVISACRSLMSLNLNGQAQAKTGSNTSKELDLSNQSKLQFLDARGTSVESIVFAEGAPLSTAYLPASLTTLRLAYLSSLSSDGLSIEGYSNISTFIFAGCPLLNWQSILASCTNVRYVRVTGIDMDGDGNLLDSLLSVGGVDEDGNYTDTCALVGSYRLTRYVDDDTLAAYVAHFPSLLISQPEYTTIKFDDDCAESANISNLDNLTGYDYDNTYAPSGHISKILAKRHRVLAKLTDVGEVTICQLHDKCSNVFADATDASKATAANLTGSMGDVMIFEPHYWYKGINDFLNHHKYAVFSSNDSCPATATGSRKVLLEELTVKNKYGLLVSTNYTTLNDAAVNNSTTSYATISVSGYKVVRWPSFYSTSYGALFLDANGNILSRHKATSSSGIYNGAYCFAPVPDGAVTLAFTFLTSATFDYVLLLTSTKIEDVEPDWVEHTPCLCGVYESFVKNDQAFSISGNVSTSSYSPSEQSIFASNRGNGYKRIDWELHKDVANLFYARYGERDSQGVVGTVQNQYAAGISNKTGMQDTRSTANDNEERPSITNDRYNSTTAYILANDGDVSRTALNVQVCMGYENWCSGKHELYEAYINKESVDHIFRSPMPDGTERLIPIAINADGHAMTMMHGRYMDILPSILGGSSTTYYFDLQGIYTNTLYSDLYMYRGGFSNLANSGISYLGHNTGESSHIMTSRLAFRGKIKTAASVAAFLAL